jgi:hypothetical protein
MPTDTTKKVSEFELQCLLDGIYFLRTPYACTMPKSSLLNMSYELLAYRKEQARMQLSLKRSEINNTGWYWMIHPDGPREIIEITDTDLIKMTDFPETELRFKGPITFPE